MTGASEAIGTPHDFAAALLDPQRATPPGLRAWNGSDPAVRLAVYRNNVLSSLLDALADTFPVVQQLVGTEFFRAMAGLFVRESPPRTRVLAHYGQAFPAFIASFPPAQGLPYLADMARLEWARVQAYHAADADPATEAAVGLALASGDRMGELRLTLHPSVQTLSSPFAVVTLWAAHQAEDEGQMGTLDLAVPQAALVLRVGLEVLVLPAPQGAVNFIDAVRAGQNLGDAAAHATAAAPTTSPTPSPTPAPKPAPGFDLTATLTLLLAHGALCAIQLPPRLPS